MKRPTRFAHRRPGVADETRYERGAIARIVNVLDAEFAGQVDAPLVAAAVAKAHARFRNAPLREYVPVMVERQARAELAAIGREPEHSDGEDHGR